MVEVAHAVGNLVREGAGAGERTQGRSFVLDEGRASGVVPDGRTQGRGVLLGLAPGWGGRMAVIRMVAVVGTGMGAWG